MRGRAEIVISVVAGVALMAMVNSVWPEEGRKVDPSLWVNGAQLKTVPPPVVRAGKLFVPAVSLRKLGLAVELRGNNSAWIGWPESDVTNVYTTSPDNKTGPFAYKKALMLPLREIVDGKIMTLQWDPAKKAARIQIRPSWKKWRGDMDMQLRREHPGWYETPVFQQTGA